jgi:DNA-binding response OmpR family regulator
MDNLPLKKGVLTENFPRSRPVARQREHVLVVEDDWSAATTCAKMLTHAGFAVSGAESVEQAWEALQSTRYHLVITDHFMPQASGLELARRMRAAGMTQPVILISGTPDIEKLRFDPADRIDDILPKPFSFYELVLRVNAALDSPQRAMTEPRMRGTPSVRERRLKAKMKKLESARS